MKRKYLYLLTLFTAFNFHLFCEGESQDDYFSAEKKSQYGIVSFTNNTSLESKINNDFKNVSINTSRLDADFSLIALTYELKQFNWQHSNLSRKKQTSPPFDKLHSLGFNINFPEIVLSENVFLFSGLNWASEFEKEIKDSDEYSGWMACVIDLNSRWEYNFGISYSKNEIESHFYPVVGINYESEHFQNYGTGFRFSLGFPETSLNYNFSNSLSYNLYIGEDYHYYRLKNENILSPKGYLKYENITFGMQINKNITENLMLSIGIENKDDYKYKIYDYNGYRLKTTEIDDAYCFQTNLSYSF